MVSERTYLETGSLLRLEDGTLYELTGPPLGSGGVSVIYPAERLREVDGRLIRDGICCALKECYPSSVRHRFKRAETGEIVPMEGDEEGAAYLAEAKRGLLAEEQVTKAIYRRASRLLPIRAVSESVILTRPGGQSHRIANTVVVMDSLAEKGRTLRALLADYGRFTAAQACRVLYQILLALREVHEAGYLHLDIQDGNILIRGALEDESDLAELIDFGAARRLGENGRTAVITDGVVFTTPGFTAPEILTADDGTLDLGPEADLYSAGCLLLMMLTGRRCDPQVLLATAKSGRPYLPRFVLNKTACPSHLSELLQSILEKALKAEPSERYASAEEMLKDVLRFLHAAAPRETALAQVRYDAFICYRHGEIDTAAAQKLQRALEHFRAPKALTGRRRPIHRVFLDKGEISAGADFGEQIDAALRHSEWLIVVCSRRTPESIWVRKEIRTFLKYHDRSRVLTVLTDGEPEEAYPQELCEGEEILAADLRSSVKHRRVGALPADELLRLTAPILGTTYETLRQRRKLFALKRALGAAALVMLFALLFSAYAFVQNRRLLASYERISLSQSKTLTAEAEERLLGGDVFGAIELALDALPEEGEDLPVWTGAEAVLSEAMNLYRGEERAQIYGVTGVLRHPYEVENFFVDEEHGRLVSFDATTVYVWDIETCELQSSRKYKDYYDEQVFSENLTDREAERVYLAVGNKVLCYDYGRDREVWSRCTEDYSTVHSVLRCDGGLVCLADRKLFLLDETTGDILRERFLPFDPLPDYSTASAAVTDERGGRAAAVMTLRSYAEDGLRKMTVLLVYDVAEDSLSLTEWTRPKPDSLLLTEDGDVLVSYAERRTGTYSRSPERKDITEERPMGTLECLKAESGESLWKKELRFDAEEKLRLQSFGTQGVLVCVGRTCLLLGEDGETVRSWELSDRIVRAQLEQDGRLTAFSENGNWAVASSEEIWNSLRLTADHLKWIDGREGVWFSLCGDDTGGGGTNILRYEQYPYDRSGLELAATDYEFRDYIQSWSFGDGVLRGIGSVTDYEADTEEGLVMFCFSDDEGEVKKISIPEVEQVTQDLGIFRRGGRDYLLLLGRTEEASQPSMLLAVDLTDGSCEAERLPRPEHLQDEEPDFVSAGGGDFLVTAYADAAGKAVKLVSLSLTDGRVTELGTVATGTPFLTEGRLCLAEDGGGLIALTEEDGDEWSYRVYSFCAGRAESLQELTGFETETGYLSSVYAGGRKGTWLSVEREALVVRERNGRVLRTLSYSRDRELVQSACFGPDGTSLFVVFTSFSGEEGYNGRLCVYDLTEEREVLSQPLSSQNPRWQFVDDRTVMLTTGYASEEETSSFVWTDGMWVRRETAAAVGYDRERAVYCSVALQYGGTGGTKRRIQLFPRRDTEELCRLGRDFLSQD